MGRHMSRPLVLGVGALALFVLALWWGFFRSVETIETEPVKRAGIENAVTALGVLQPQRYVDVGAQVSGQIKRIAVKPASRVAQGDLLVEIDPALQRATRESLDLAATVARVQQAQANARVAGATLVPELTGTLGASREGPFDGGEVGSDFRAGLAASYEVGFWGRNCAGWASARASLAATIYDHDTARLTVTAGAASLWLQVVALHERGAIAERNLQTAERLLQLVESRTRAGAATPLELAQQRGLVASQRRTSAAQRQQAEDTRIALGVLIGIPAGIGIETRSLASLHEPAIGAGVPAELLTRRPDIARAEAGLAAATADVAAARAAMLPSVTLTGGVDAAGNRLGRIFDNPLYSLAAGRDLALARREELLADYRQVIIAAFGNVEAALDAQREAPREELAQAGQALTLAESRYRAGTDTLLTLLDAQRTLYAPQVRAARLQADVALYRALGGGWRGPPVSIADSRSISEAADAARKNAALRLHAESPGS